MKIVFVVAADEANGIGVNNQLLCHLPDDLQHFKNLTLGHTILMGSNTFRSIGKALPKRVNYVLSKNLADQEGIVVFRSPEEAMQAALQNKETLLFVIGGDQVFKAMLPLCNELQLTRIHHRFEADTFFPELSTEWQLQSEVFHDKDENHAYSFTFQTWVRAQVSEPHSN